MWVNISWSSNSILQTKRREFLKFSPLLYLISTIGRSATSLLRRGGPR